MGGGVEKDFSGWPGMDKAGTINHHHAVARRRLRACKRVKPFFTLRALDVQVYRLCDDLSGALILPMLVFGPWAFGTTQPWSIACMNAAGFALGLLLLL